MRKDNNIRRCRAGLKPLLLYIFLFLIAKTQAQLPGVVAEYIYSSESLSFKFPDSVTKKVAVISDSGVSIKAGSLKYVCYNTRTKSITEIKFIPFPGFEMIRDISTAYLENDFKALTYRAFDNGEIKVSLTYFLPQLSISDRTEIINGYHSKVYTFVNTSGVKYNVWISDNIPVMVNPGFCFPDLGGITKVEYYTKNEYWALDLLGFRNEREIQFPFVFTSDTVSQEKVLYPFFNVK